MDIQRDLYMCVWIYVRIYIDVDRERQRESYTVDPPHLQGQNPGLRRANCIHMKIDVQISVYL